MVLLQGQNCWQSSLEQLIEGEDDSRGRSSQPLTGDCDTERFCFNAGQKVRRMKKEKSDLAKSDYRAILKRVTANSVLLHGVCFIQKNGGCGGE